MPPGWNILKAQAVLDPQAIRMSHCTEDTPSGMPLVYQAGYQEQQRPRPSFTLGRGLVRRITASRPRCGTGHWTLSW